MRYSNAFFERIVSIAADAIVTVDDAQRIVQFNHSAELLFGYSLDEVLGQSLEILIPERHRPRHHAYVALFLASTEAARLLGHRQDVFGRRKDGTEFPVEASILKFHDPDGGRFLAAVVRDVTDRKLLEYQQQFLANAGALLSSSLEYEDMVTLVTQIAVPAIADIATLDLITEAGTLQRTAFAPPDSPLSAAAAALRDRFPVSWDSPSAVVDVMQSGEPLLVERVTDTWLESHCEHADEVSLIQQLDLASLVILPLVGRGHIVGALSLYIQKPRGRYGERDVMVGRAIASRAALALDNARLYRNALRATFARDEVLGVVSHDLRNPLSTIFMCTSTLQRHLTGDVDERRELLSVIHDSAKWMSRLIRDLLDNASIEAGKLSLSPQVEPVAPIVEQVGRMFVQLATAKGIDFSVHVDPATPSIFCDSERIIQALANLVNNAIKFTPADARIVVRAAPRGSEVLLQVQDTGRGISEADLPHVFERHWFQRRRGEDYGCGLGLGITRGIVEAHGGRIEVFSQLGVGTTFSMTFPVAADESVIESVTNEDACERQAS